MAALDPHCQLLLRRLVYIGTKLLYCYYIILLYIYIRFEPRKPKIDDTPAVVCRYILSLPWSATLTTTTMMIITIYNASDGYIDISRVCYFFINIFFLRPPSPFTRFTVGAPRRRIAYMTSIKGCRPIFSDVLDNAKQCRFCLRFC